MAEMPGKNQFLGTQQNANSGGFRLDSARFGTLEAFKVQLDGTRWRADPVGPTVGFDPPRRQLSASSRRRPSARASWDNSTKSASSSAETMASRWSSKSERRALLVMFPSRRRVAAAATARAGDRRGSPDPSSPRRGRRCLRAARSGCRLTGSHRAARSCAPRRAPLR
jgi:hypothetical protein